ncbi:prephenate dehydrogenase [Demequina sp. B12]|uniref:prephenate dehydrogenase n=1 Tax=Demequina sp. B12 TaxID=2992757 RepID=UPI00237A9055|nr:prephenate dehydrogenase [Demequina sp. B12]MDE0573142.1 prephenate dehydrogenase [Demequina sp. B12]
MSESATPRVHIVGAGLIGASVGIGLSADGWAVTIEDVNDESARVARAIGAGGVLGDESPELVVVAAPPSVAPAVVQQALRAWADAVVTDVASVKQPIADAATAVDASRYVGSHPMAGREISGATAAQGDLFKARPWVVCPGQASEHAVSLVTRVARTLQGDVVVMDAAAHDAAVARVSHAPQVAASAVAAALGPLRHDDVALAGQGLRDVTRIAASHPAMWADIARLNRESLEVTLDHIIGDLEDVREADDIGEALTDLMERGRLEVARIPGKHGGPTRDWVPITVIVPDEPGQLLKLLSDAAAVGVNVEDITIEHSPRQPVGLTTLHVLPERAQDLLRALTSHQWEIASP